MITAMSLLTWVLLAVAASGAIASSESLTWGSAETDMVSSEELRGFGISVVKFKELLAHKNAILERLRELEQLAEEYADPRLEEDAKLSTPELIQKYGYPSETHEIVTEDGYILTFHRIPYGQNSTTKTPNSRPLYLQHGLMSSSDDWIVPGPENGLGYILADAGYDVWIGNSRGNKWSRRHQSLDPKKKHFWTFSWHEMGVYDLPAAIDYILENTGKEALHYVGHSMGTTMFTVMGAERPEYNAKIKTAALLAPAVFFEYNKNIFYKLLTPFIHQLDILSQVFGVNEMFKHHYLYSVVGDKLCKDSEPTQILCLAVANLIGVDTAQVNKTLLPVLLAHFPSGAATKDYLHYGQSIKSGDFRQYDHGKIKNLLVYGQPKPPKYDVAKVTAPVIIHYAQNDGTVMPEDAETLAGLLPNLIDFNKVPNEKFNHLDFVISVRAKELVYDLLISQLNQF